MIDIPLGTRVGAILKAAEDTIWLIGYGTYQGEKIPDPALGVSIFGKPMTEPNPFILLDSGAVIFGCECWWGPADFITTKVAGYQKVILVDISAERKSPSDD